jgi:hypothetical protein
MLPVSLDCQFLIAPTVFFVVEFCFVCPRLMFFVSHVASVSRGQSRIDNLETLATWETKDIRRGQTKQNSTTKKTVGAIKN